jgi:hypothetical protein
MENTNIKDEYNQYKKRLFIFFSFSNIRNNI